MVFLSSKDDYTIVFANHQFLNLYGLEEGAVTGRKCFASLHNCLVPCTEKSVADGQCGHKQVFETGLPVIVKHRHVLPDGSEKIFQISVSPLFDEKGAVSQIVHVTKDITEQEQLQEKLQISLVEQEMIFNNCPFFVTYLDPELRVININSSMEKLIGKKASEVQGKYCYEVWGQHAGDTTRRGREKICDICRVQDAMANGQNYSYERKVGDKYIDVTSSPVRDRNGKVIGALESGKDITEWKETTKALRLSENRYGCLFNHLNDAAFVFRLDGTLQETNEIAENRLGYSREEFLRMPQTQIEGFGFGNNHHKQLQKIRETGSLFFETVHVTKDGRAIPTEISASFIDLNGDSCVLALARDISERKQAEEVLRKNEEQLRLIAENISEAFWMADIEIGKTFYISPAYERIWGRSLQSLRENPRSFLEAIHPDDKARVLTDLERKKSGQPFDHEYRIVRPDGMVRWIWDRGFPVQEPAGKVHRYVGIAQDITERKQVEKVLREQESRYRTLLDQATDAIFVSDMNGRLIDVNREACEGLGYSREELLTLGICDVDPRFETEEHAKKAWEKLTPGRTLTIESSHRRKDGSLFPVEIHVGKLEIVGQPAILGIARDISERQQAEEELKTHQAFLQNALDALTHPFYVIDANDYTIKMSNQASHFGEYLEGTKCFQLTHNRSEPCGGDEHPCSLLEIKRTKQPVVVEHIHVDQAGKEQSVEIHAYPIFDSSGNLSQVIEYCLDISERKKGEEERRRLVTAIEQGIDSVVITDKQGMIQYVNPSFEKISGYSKEEVIGRNPRILQSGNHDALFYQEMWTTLASGKAWQGHLINRKKDGTLFEEEASITPVLNEAGEIINYVAVKRDVTEQRKLEEQLQQAQKMEAMGTLAGGIAHDFNNILSAILGYSEFVKQALPPGTAAREDIDQVINSGKRATALVQQILDFSRKTEQKLQPLRPHLIVEEVLQMLRSTLPTSIEIQADIDPACGTIMADPTKLHQVILNLCTNGFHAMKDEKGILRITLSRQNRRAKEVEKDKGSPIPFIVLSVSDTGYGMSPETAAHIFDPYFTTKEKGDGTGLGLAVVHGIIEGYKGFIEVESRLGHGTTFRVFIPALEKNSAVSERPKQQEALPTGTERILVVDDEPLLVTITTRILEDYGYTVTGLTDSREAVEKVRAEPQRFDLIVTDQTMPGLTGSELAKAVLEIAPDMPIILCTGHSAVTSEEDASAMGIKRYVYKPVDGDELVRIIRKILDER